MIFQFMNFSIICYTTRLHMTMTLKTFWAIRGYRCVHFEGSYRGLWRT